ncbi:MAG: hypothetical protein JW984_16320 [Deltaproteobacteria bacterium]|uniref:Uncharacterized protein n=1 Tax=Candidatus Zymogenus saltonus TaxID=2844893 RepID=A0A9D8KI03_9DELT|nr:hypothetical protein [Candidatus Zymogenus saltonus]
MDRIKNKTGVVLVFAAIVLLFAGSVSGQDLYRNVRNNNTGTSSKTGYGSCINPGSGSYCNYAWRNNPAGTMPGGFLRFMIKRNQYDSREQYYNENRNWYKERRLDGARGRNDRTHRDGYDRYNRGYYNWSR